MATPTGFSVYDSDNEVEHRFTELIALVAWLDEHEHAGFTTVQNWRLDDLLRQHIERWSRESGAP
jgi:TorA maturation chaperone TorD